jgi:hypothetical protein
VKEGRKTERYNKMLYLNQKRKISNREKITRQKMRGRERKEKAKVERMKFFFLLFLD